MPARTLRPQIIILMTIINNRASMPHKIKKLSVQSLLNSKYIEVYRLVKRCNNMQGFSHEI